MNRSITGAWAVGGSGSSSASHRRTKISLNSAVAPSSGEGDGRMVQATLPPPGSAAAAALARMEEENSNSGAAASQPEADASNGMIPESQKALLSDVTAEPPSSPLPGKRKQRIGSSTTGNSEETTAPALTAKRRKATTRESAPGGSKKIEPSAPTTRLKDLGGVSNALDKILELIAMPLCHPEIYAHTGVKAPRGVLLHGPPGCGKTMLAGALAGDLNVPLLSISSPTIVSGTSGESEQTLRNLFEQAIQMAPCILFLDEIDAITPKRETAQREMERRIVAQLLTCLDDLTWDKTEGRPVMVIGATNRPDSLDPALRRAGRFDHEIALGVPDENGREEILKILCSNLRLSGDFDLRALAKATPGYVGADLVALTAAAGIRAVKRIFNELAEEGKDVLMEEGGDGVDMSVAKLLLQESTEGVASGTQTPISVPDEENGGRAPSSSTYALPSASLFEALPPSLKTSAIAVFLRSNPEPLSKEKLDRLRITPADFTEALPTIQPSSKREGFATVPEVTWADIGALEETREELEMTIVEPIKRPELFNSIGVTNSGGVLLWGPPGCGKTLLAKAVANESGANFISVKGPELLNKYVGESERAVRQVFARARTSSPCVIFFDELDALVPRRDDALSESSSRVVNTLLTELDGLEARVQTYVIGATNRPDMIDPAMCRPGRLDKMLYVDLPNQQERIKILRTLTKKTPLSAQEEGAVDWLETVALDTRCEGFSGADLAALVREASVLALREKLKEHRTEETAAGAGAGVTGVISHSIGHQVRVNQSHFDAALDKVQPSVGISQRKKYDSLRSRLSGFPGGRNSEQKESGQKKNDINNSAD